MRFNTAYGFGDLCSCCCVATTGLQQHKQMQGNEENPGSCQNKFVQTLSLQFLDEQSALPSIYCWETNESGSDGKQIRNLYYMLLSGTKFGIPCALRKKWRSAGSPGRNGKIPYFCAEF